MKRIEGYVFGTGKLLLILLASGWFCPPAMGQAQTQGQWTTLPYTMPINPIHVSLMHNGKVLVVSGSGNYPPNTNYQAAVWDPKAGTITTQPVAYDMFCNGMVELPDGRPFILGGTLQYDPFEGLPNASYYDPKTGNFVGLQSMAHGRWYPTGTTLGDGRIMVFSGLDENGNTNTAVEFYTVGAGWSQQYPAGWTPSLYPRMHLLPNGTLFNSGYQPNSYIFDPSTQTWTNSATTNYGSIRTYGSSVLLPLTPANSYDPRVMIFGGGNPATNTTEIIDLSASTPKWQYSAPMSQPRIEMNAVILPSGKVLALGGSTNDEDATTASLNADLFDPVAGTMSSAGANAYPRLYHSNGLLLPDATVALFGGNPERGTYEPHIEIYSPAYLFTTGGIPATRPTISSVSPGVIGYGSSFQVVTPNAANIASVVLVRPGSPTHASDMDQRLVGLSFTQGSGALTVTGPPNGNIAPPGYYLLFLLNTAGVPSVATFIQVSYAPTDQPPTGTITSPTSNVTIQAGQSVSFSGTGSDPDGTISAYSWVFPGGSPASSSLQNPGSVTFSTPGTYVASLTVTDNAGLNDPSPPTRTITVESGGGGGAITYVQGNYAVPHPSATTVAVPFTAAQSGGDLNVVVVGWNDTTAAVSSVTDKSGNTYALAVGPTLYSSSTEPFSQSIYYAKNIAAAAAGANSVTVTFSTAAAYPDIRILEYSGADPNNPVDVTAASSGNSTTSSSGAATTTNPTDLLFAANTVWTTTTGPGSGFTQRLLTSPNGDIAEDEMVMAAGSYSATAPLSGPAGSWVMQMVAFRTPGAPSPNFALSASPTSLSVVPGNQGTSTITTTVSGGFSSAISLSAAGAPSGTTVSFNPSTIPAPGAGNSTMTITVGASTAVGTYPITVLGNGGETQQSATVTLTVSTAPNFTLTGSPASVSVSSGNQGTSTITTTISGGFSSAISLSATGAPSGTTVSFNPSSIAAPGAGSSTMTMAVGSSTAAGTYPITVTGSGGGIQRSAAVTLTVTTAGSPNFTLAASPTSATVVRGGQGTSTITTTVSSGFNNAISLSATGAPTGTTVSFNPSTIAAPGAGSSTMTMAVGSSTALGTYSITVTGSGGGIQQKATITLKVVATISYVQGNYAVPHPSATTVNITFNAAQAAGDLNVVVVGWNDTTAAVSRVTDRSGNTYALAVGPTTDSSSAEPNSQSIYYAKNIAAAAAGANTVTVTFSTAAAYPDIRILEYSGADPNNPVDVTAASNGNSTTSSSGSATTTNPTDLLFGANIVWTTTTGPGSGFTQRILTSPNGDLAEDRMVTAKGTYSATAPLGSAGSWVMQMVAFR